MALTVVFALGGSLVCALTLMPVLASFFLTRVRESEPWLFRVAKHAYLPLLGRALHHRRTTVAVAVGAFLSSLALVPLLGAEFIPRLDEGAIAMQIWLFSAFFIDGYAAAGSSLVGRFAGAHDRGSVYRVSWRVVRQSVLIGMALAGIYLLAYGAIGRLFTADPAVLTLLTGVFWMVIVTQPINAVAFAFDGVYKGLGEGRILRNALLATTALVFVPLILLGDAWGWQLHAVWTAFLGWMLARGGVLAFHFQRNHGPRAMRAQVLTSDT